jgi:hypothetical protein
MYEVFTTVDGRTVGYKATEREALDYTTTMPGTDYNLAPEGYYIEVHAYKCASTIMPYRYNEKNLATQRVDLFNMGSDTKTYTLVPILSPIG